MEPLHTDTRPPVPAAEPWWRVGMVWLVIGGPLIVVVASAATLFIALTHPDPVLNTPASGEPSQRPALQARNHAANPPQPAEARQGSAR